MISVVTPAHDEESNIAIFFEAVSVVLKQLVDKDYEVIFIDDGSEDKTWHEITELRSSHCRGIKFSRNFGKEAAIYAGLSKAKGDCCIVMDCDLQHPPEYIRQMYQYYLSGYQIVQCVRKQRGRESLAHMLLAWLFYRIFGLLCPGDLNITNASDFKLLDRNVVQYILQFKEKSFFFRGITAYIGYKSINIEYEIAERVHGKSQWSYGALMKYAISNMAAFSVSPLQIVTFSGCALLMLAVLLTIRTLYVFAIHEAAPGITTVIILLLFIGSVIMISLGIIGYYIAKIYTEVKSRPLFIIDREI